MKVKLNWRSVLYLLLVGVAIALIVGKWAELSQLWREHLLTFIIVTALMFLSIIVQANNFLSFMPMPCKIDGWSLSKVWALGALVNYLGPFQPGIAVRFAYLKQNDIQLRTALLATARQSLVSVWISLAGISFGTLLQNYRSNKYIALVFGIIFLLLPMLRNLIIRALDFIDKKKIRIAKKDVIAEALSEITCRSILGVLLQYGMGTVLLYIVYSRFGANIDLEIALLMTCAIYISTLVALIPGNFGVMEIIYVFGGHQLGMSTGDAIALAFLLRASHITSCFLMSMLLSKNIGQT